MKSRILSLLSVKTEDFPPLGHFTAYVAFKEDPKSLQGVAQTFISLLASPNPSETNPLLLFKLPGSIPRRAEPPPASPNENGKAELPAALRRGLKQYLLLTGEICSVATSLGARGRAGSSKSAPRARQQKKKETEKDELEGTLEPTQSLPSLSSGETEAQRRAVTGLRSQN